MKLGPTIAASFAFICALMIAGWRIASSGKEGFSSNDSVGFAQLKDRPLNLPSLPAGEGCPVSHGSQNTVPHASYVFCSGCFWFGKGPVFLALAWSDQSTDEGRFPLERVPYEDHAYRAKTPWVSKPDYAGPILIRGRSLTGNEKLRFSEGGNKLTDVFELEALARGRDDLSRWSFWPTSMFVPRPGCYGIQIDTSHSTDVVIFEAYDGR